MAGKSKTTKPAKTEAEKAAAKKAKADKFIELGRKRMTVALAKIGLLKNLANKNQYVYTEEQADKIVKALTDRVTEIKTAFAATGSSKDEGGFVF